MSLAELLPAIRALPRAEQVQLLHLLVDGVAEASPPNLNEIPVELRKQLPTTAEVWFPEPNPGAVAAALQVLHEGRDGG